MTNLPTLTEYQESVIFADWLRAKNIPFTHIVNESGGKGSPAYDAKLKRMGRSKGFPDYLVFVPKFAKYVPLEHEIEEGSYEKNGSYEITVGYIPLAVKLKRSKGGTTSDEQKQWINILLFAGLKAKVCHGADDATKFVERFL